MESHVVTVMLLGLAVVLAIVAFLVARLRKMSLQLYEISGRLTQMQFDFVAVTQQPEALALLNHELELKRPLPPTRGWAASPDFLLIIARHALLARPKVIVECGSGTSTVVLARCCQKNGGGHIYSLDHEAEFAQQTRDQLALHGLEAFATVIHAPLTPCKIGEKTWPWYKLENVPELPAIDMLIVDGPPMPTGRLIRYPAGPILAKRLAPGGKAFLDDGDRPDEKEMAEMWLKEIPGLGKRHMYAEKGCIELTRGA